MQKDVKIGVDYLNEVDMIDTHDKKLTTVFTQPVLILILFIFSNSTYAANMTLSGVVEAINLESQLIRINAEDYSLDDNINVIYNDNKIGHEQIQAGMKITYDVNISTLYTHSTAGVIEKIEVISTLVPATLQE